MNGYQATLPSRKFSSNVLKAVTLAYLVVLVPSSIWYGLSGKTVLVTNLLFDAADLVGARLLLSNLLFACFTKGYRPPHLILAILLVAAWEFTWWTHGWLVDSRRRSFVQGGSAAYDEAVSNVLRNRALLTDKQRTIEDVIRGHPHAKAWTNTDGSTTIIFPEREGNYRRGYLYHSGSRLPPYISSDPEIFHLTNGWYEY